MATHYSSDKKIAYQIKDEHPECPIRIPTGARYATNAERNSSYLAKENINPTTELEIERQLRAFLAIPKGSFAKENDRAATVDSFFNEHQR